MARDGAGRPVGRARHLARRLRGGGGRRLRGHREAARRPVGLHDGRGLRLPERRLRRQRLPGLPAVAVQRDRPRRGAEDRRLPEAVRAVGRGTIRSTMRTMKAIHDGTCSVAACAEIIGAKWTALLVHDLSEGPRRFSELEHSCVGISPRTLSERLRALEDEGLVERRSYAESPPRVEYELTEKGGALLPIIAEMRQFGHAYLTA